MQPEPSATAVPTPEDRPQEDRSPEDREPEDREPEDRTQRLTVAAVARRLGIAPATLRTWDRRYGIGPGEHVPGRHRRYSADDVARMELMQHALLRGVSPADAARYARTARLPRPSVDGPRRLPPHPAPEPPPAGADPGGPLLLADGAGDGRAASRVRVGGRALRLPGAGREARGLGRAALALDATAIGGLLQESLDARGVEATWETVARPVLNAVGQRWADTGAGVEIEHLISECVITAFGRYAAGAPAARNPRPVLLAGMPGELHVLPLVALSTALAERAVECRSLGSNLPSDALVAAIRRVAPAAVVLWSQTAPTADVGLLRWLPRTRPRFRVYVAGPGWAGRELPPRVGRLDSLAGAGRELVAAVLT